MKTRLPHFKPFGLDPKRTTQALLQTMQGGSVLTQQLALLSESPGLAMQDAPEKSKGPALPYRVPLAPR